MVVEDCVPHFVLVGKEYFHDTAVDVTTDGRPAPVGTLEYLESFTIDKILSWISAVDILSSIAMSQPHAAPQKVFTTMSRHASS